MGETKYYSLKNILTKNAQYNVIFGERSNGKTYAGYEYGIKRYLETGEQFALVRRWGEDLVGKRGTVMFDTMVCNGKGENAIKILSKGKWNAVHYYSSRWYLANVDNETKTKIVDETPFAYGFAITSGEHDKSTSYPRITTVIFDEFLSRTAYAPDEFVLFMNVLSTIIRDRNNVKIFMFGNTVSKYCPYFHEMGLKHIKEMKQGDIDIYTYGESGLRVAVEYVSPTKGGKASDLYFAFDNSRLQMVTTGGWEMDIYPHCPCKYKPKDVVYRYFIHFDGELLECEVVATNDSLFTFIHRKSTPTKELPYELVYTTEYSEKPNYRRKINKPLTNLEKKIYNQFVADKVFYADNEVGEVVRNYLMFCGVKV